MSPQDKLGQLKMNNHKLNWSHFIIFALFLFFYVYNIDGWLMHDDEGTDFYESWQLQQGKKPGVDFIAAQQPLFLNLGKLIIDLNGRDPQLLRLSAAVQVLIGAIILALTIRKIWGTLVATLSFGLTLSSGMVYEQARLFRPDPMMLGWEMLGLAVVLLAVTQKRKLWWMIAGFSYGFSMLWKLFGVFPVVGLIFYFFYLLVTQRSRWPEIVMNGVCFSAPFLLVSLGGSLLLYNETGFYYAQAFEQHLQLGQGTGLLVRSSIAIKAYLYFFLVNSIFLFIFPLLWLNSHFKRNHSILRPVLVGQLLSPAIFLFMTRPMHLRYYFYLTPILAIILARQIQIASTKISAEQSTFLKYITLVIFVFLGFALVTSRPSVYQLMSRNESDTVVLSEYVAANTSRADIVLSDYAGINFLSNRDSIYEASIIAGGKIGGGIITTDLLIERIEENNVKMALVHVAGGDPLPHQLIALPDYERFQAYLQQNFELLTVFDRAGQRIEVYKRP